MIPSLSFSASSSAKSGDAGGGMFGPVSIGGIGSPVYASSGGMGAGYASSGGAQNWMLPAAILIAALLLIRR